jgi:hypothetical protein
MAGGLARPLTIRRQAPTAPLELSWKDFKVEEGSPWSIRLIASCYLAAATINVGPTPRIELAVLMGSKHVDAIGQIDFDLLNPVWGDILNDAASTCANYLVRRQVPVPDEFRELLLVGLRESRIKAIHLVVRYQAMSLISHISSEEACRIWAEAEASHIFDS